jgi:hypothetical protein
MFPLNRNEVLMIRNLLSRTASTFRNCPLDVIHGSLDVTSLAMKAILSVDL